ncbi:hypothetical protein [Nodularia spumigena]|jgi:hypothetical protein|uniref:hypothetical protein n=1 Tax=Nodularia spumigena TaxID=70799 RepID=UPI00232CBFF0|nr:hypothetical protein [Nodularia spumigena]MDB9500044.1 hypothetical protein [Nodularia spumigena CS-336/02]
MKKLLIQIRKAVFYCIHNLVAHPLLAMASLFELCTIVVFFAGAVCVSLIAGGGSFQEMKRYDEISFEAVGNIGLLLLPLWLIMWLGSNVDKWCDSFHDFTEKYM